VVDLDNKPYKMQGTYIRTVKMYFQNFSFCGCNWTWQHKTLLPNA